MKKILISLFAVLMMAVLFSAGRRVMSKEEKSMDMKDTTMKMPKETKTAVFAGGCFWCTEASFEKVHGVIDAISGYTGGHVVNPTYEEVSAGGTGHVEAVKVIYDPKQLTYKQLLAEFWRMVDPTDPGGQFVDRGSQYRSVIFYANEHQRKLAEASKKMVAASGIFKKPIVTEILPLGPFYRAEDYHQNYYKKNPIRYHYYRYRSGRDQFLRRIWGEDPAKTWREKVERVEKAPMADAGQSYVIPDDATLRKRLTPLQYDVVRENGTEPAFHNKYWDNHTAGIYVDIVSGEPLFSSLDKFDSGTGWPSFTRPLVPANIVEKTDHSFFTTRTEVRSKHANSHLGHVFRDGPPPTGLRYCINSAALRFIPADQLKKDGYGAFAALFK